MNYILTGGHSGIGLELTKILLHEGHQLGLIVRSEKRKKDTIDLLGKDVTIDYFIADLSDRDEIIKVASAIASKYDSIDGLFNNAGLLADKAYYSKYGNEMQLEINAIAPYLLAKVLQPILAKAKNPFVVNTGTGGMHQQKKTVTSELKKPTKFVKLLGSYLNSKVAMMLMMNNLGEAFPNIRIVTVDPGPNKTKMTNGTGMPRWLLPIRNLFFPKPTKGAKKIHQATFDDIFQQKSGIYVTGNKIKPITLSYSDKEVQEILS